MKILGLIPARGGSKSIPRKNLAALGGRPLIEWTIRTARDSALDEIIVSTDDTEIAEVSSGLGANVPFMRPHELAQDGSLTIDVVLHALNSVAGTYDAVMVLQPTSPLRMTHDINESIRIFCESGPDSVISVVDVGGHHPARMKYLRDGRLIDPSYCESYENQPRQELESMFIRNGAIYLTKTEVLMRRSFKGSVSMGYVMPAERSVNVDDPIDLLVAEALADKL